MPQPLYTPAVVAFRALHESGCFLIPNPWDIGTARLLAHLGFKALATTSAGFAFSQGKPDMVAALSRDDVIEHIKSIVDATPLPVNADYQNGYASDPEAVADNVTLCVQTGAAGLSIEDATGDPSSPLYEERLSVERIRAARAAIDTAGTGTLLTARCEAFLVGMPNAEQVTLRRLVAFADAGADCLFAPRVADLRVVSEIVRAVAPKPVNVLVATPIPGFTVARLAEIGARRISVGSALSRVALGAIMASVKHILESGEFGTLGEAASFDELNNIFSQ